jgi:VWFA-related protein
MKTPFHISSSIPLLILLATACFAPPVRAQAAQEADETIRVDTELVNLNVSVFNRDPSRTVGQLQQKDFTVLEDGKPQEIAFFASAPTPFDLVLLLDLSGSTADKLELIRGSAKRFISASRPTDRIAVVTFTDRPHLVSPLASGRYELLKAIDQIKKPKGETRFWDALRYVLEKVLNQSNNASHRSAVVVMTDGVDNALPNVKGQGSVTPFEELLEMVKRSDTIVVPIYLDTEREMVENRSATEMTYLIARGRLGQLATESGSVVYQASRVEDLYDVYTKVIRDLGTVYSLGYRPLNKLRDGKWRAVAVGLATRTDLSARTKRGYYAK